MKRYSFLFLLVLIANNKLLAQLPDGTTVPDFTFVDINGNTQHLYSYLDSGKYVAIDVFTTWCGPCWAYKNAGIMDSLYTLHDNPGDHTWKVLEIEADNGTTLADIQGTGTNTQGNWTTGTSFPIMNPSGVTLNDFIAGYNISFYPTLYVICPNRKVYQSVLNGGTKPDVSGWENFANASCGPAGLDDINDVNSLAVYPDPAGAEVTLRFALSNSSRIQLTVSNTVGQVEASNDYGVLAAGNHNFTFDISRLSPGLYIFTLSGSNGRSIRRKVSVL